MPPLDGTAIVSAASGAAAKFFEATFTELEERIKTIVPTNTTDPVLMGAVNTMTTDLIKQLQDRLSTLFTNVGKAPTGRK
ncbi:MAG: hypothetical protein V3U53_07225 [bacterium]